MQITDHGLHVVPGDAAGRNWREAFDAEDRLLVHQDDLSSGPLIQTSDLNQWNTTRSEFWHKVHPEWGGSFYEGSRDDSNRKKQTANLERLKTSETIYIWVSNGIRDQLFLLFMVNLLSRFGVNSEQVRIVQFKSLSEWRIPWCPLSVIPPEDLRTMPRPSHLTPETMADYIAAWRAVTADSPTEIMNYLDQHPNGCQYVRHALERLLLRYPHERSGLPSFDFRLLKNMRAEDPGAFGVIARTLRYYSEAGDDIHSKVLFKRLRRLGSDAMPEPLVKLHGPQLYAHDTQVTLTPFGKAIVNGTACSWPTNPIDDWIGGVRISAENPPQWMVTTEGKLRRI